MWRGLIAGVLGSDVAARVGCETHDCLGIGVPCRIAVRFAEDG
jgi:hypothetical protein